MALYEHAIYSSTSECTEATSTRLEIVANSELVLIDRYVKSHADVNDALIQS